MEGQQALRTFEGSYGSYVHDIRSLQHKKTMEKDIWHAKVAGAARRTVGCTHVMSA